MRPDPLELIGYNYMDGQMPVPFVLTSIALGWVVAAMIVLGVLHSMGAIGPLGTTSLVIYGACLGLPPAAVHAIFGVARRRRTRAEGKHTDQRCHAPWGDVRVRCVATPEELDELKDVQTELFEPNIARITVGWMGRLGSWLRARYSFALAFGPILLLVAVDSVFGHLPGIGLFAVVALFWRLGPWIRPTYYRVIPGRFDELRFWCGQDVGRTTRSVSLRNARVCIRLDKLIVEVHNEAPGAAPELIPLGGIQEYHDFCRVVASAAITNAPTPAIPDDRLLG